MISSKKLRNKPLFYDSINISAAVSGRLKLNFVRTGGSSSPTILPALLFLHQHFSLLLVNSAACSTLSLLPSSAIVWGNQIFTSYWFGWMQSLSNVMCRAVSFFLSAGHTSPLNSSILPRTTLFPQATCPVPKKAKEVLLRFSFLITNLPALYVSNDVFDSIPIPPPIFVVVSACFVCFFGYLGCL